MQGLCADQAQYCLKSLSGRNYDAVLVSNTIRDIANATGRSRYWVRKALIRDGFLEDTGSGHEKLRGVDPRRGHQHIKKVLAGRNLHEAAQFLGAGDKLFQGLVADGMIKKIRNRIFAKPRYDLKELTKFQHRIDGALFGPQSNSPEFISLARACFGASCRTSQILTLLLAGDLPSSFVADGNSGLDGIRVNLSELKTALARGRDQWLTMEDLRRLLGFQHHEVRTLIFSGLLPHYSGSKAGRRRHAIVVKPSDYNAFLERFHTCRTAAKILRKSEKQLRSLIQSRRLKPAPEGGGARIYLSADLKRL